MKKATELVLVWGSSAVLIAAIVVILSGCRSSVCPDCGPVEYPTVERWWK